jgi:hypothetical protein
MRKGYHQVAGIVGIAVQNDEIEFFAVQDIILDILILVRFQAEDATWIVHFLDIFHAPGRPQILHNFLLKGYDAIVNVFSIKVKG